MKQILLLILGIAFFAHSYAQPTWYKNDFSTVNVLTTNPTDTNKVKQKIANGENFVTGFNNQVFAVVGPCFYPWGFGFNIKYAPYMKFRAKRTTAGNQGFYLSGEYTDGTDHWNISKTISLTTSYQDFFYDFSSDFATLEAGGRVVKNVVEIYFHLNAPVAAPANDDGLYFDEIRLGDSANPCANKRPTLTSITSKYLNFNSGANNIDLSGITDGGDNDGAITITAKSTDTTVLRTNVVYNSPDATGTLQLITANPPKTGMPNIIVTVTDTSYCNFKIERSFSATVKSEALKFSFPTAGATTYTMNNVKNTVADQSINIIDITNGSGNFQGYTLKSVATTGSSLITAYSDVMTIDSASGGTAAFTFTPDPTKTGQAKFTVTLESQLTGNKLVKYIVLNIVQGPNTLNTSAAQELTVYPNPASDVINVVLPEGGAESIEVVDMAGKVVKAVSTAGVKGNVAVQAGDLAKGSYIVRAGNATANVILK